MIDPAHTIRRINFSVVSVVEREFFHDAINSPAIFACIQVSVLAQACWMIHIPPRFGESVFERIVPSKPVCIVLWKTIIYVFVKAFIESVDRFFMEFLSRLQFIEIFVEADRNPREFRFVESVRVGTEPKNKCWSFGDFRQKHIAFLFVW